MSTSRPLRSLAIAGASVAGLLLAAASLNGCSSAVAEDTTGATAPVVEGASKAPSSPTPSSKSTTASKPPTKAFCRDLAQLLNSDAAHELVAAEMNIDSDQAHAALLQYIPKLQRFVDGLDDTTPDNVRSTLGQFNTNLQNKILQRTITADDLDLIKYTDDDLRHYTVTTCGQKLQY